MYITAKILMQTFDYTKVVVGQNHLLTEYGVSVKTVVLAN